MTERSEQIMNMIKKIDRKRRILDQLNDPGHKNRLIGDINLLDQDEPARVGGGDQEIKILTEMNELQQFDNNNWSRNGCSPLPHNKT